MSGPEIDLPAGAPSPSAPAGAGTTTSIRKRAVRASAVTLGGYATAQLLRIGSNMTLTRLLFPEAFGLMALISVLTAGLQMLSDVGIGPSIVQHERGEDVDFLDTAWTVQVMRGLLLWSIGIAIAYPYAWLYDEPQLVLMTMVATSHAAIAGLSSTKLYGLSRRMEVGRIVGIDLTAQISSIVTMVIIAWIYETVWALPIGALVAALVKTVLSQLAIEGPVNRLRWHRESSRDILHFGKWIFVSTLVGYVALRLDIFVLGRLLPLDLLGIYSIAGLLAALPQLITGRLMNAVLFPALAEAARKDRAGLPQALAEVRAVMLPAAMAAVLAIVVLGPAFFRLLYDDRYHDAGWIAQLLMASAWFGLLIHVGSRTLLALGDSRSLAIANAVRLGATIIGSLGGYWLGELPGLIIGVAGGGLAGYASLSVSLRGHGLSTMRDDAGYCLAALVIACFGAYGPQLLGEALPGHGLIVYEILSAALVLLPISGLLAHRARSSMRARH